MFIHMMHCFIVYCSTKVAVRENHNFSGKRSLTKGPEYCIWKVKPNVPRYQENEMQHITTRDVSQKQ